MVNVEVQLYLSANKEKEKKKEKKKTRKRETDRFSRKSGSAGKERKTGGRHRPTKCQRQ